MAETTNFNKKTASVLDVLNMLSVAAGNAFDGALDDEGNPKEIGLSREEEVTIKDRRLMDGFGVKFNGNKVIVSYTAEMMLVHLHNMDIKKEVAEKIAAALKYLKKEYRKLTSKTLTLTQEDKEPKILMQSISRVRTWVQATQAFKLGGEGVDVIDSSGNEYDDPLRKTVEKFLSVGKDKYDGAKKSKSDTRKKLSEKTAQPRLRHEGGRAVAEDVQQLVNEVLRNMVDSGEGK